MDKERDIAPSHSKPKEKSVLRRVGTLIKNDRSTLIIAVVLLLLLVLLQTVMSGDIQRLDGSAYQFFVVYLRRSWLTPFMEGLSTLATPAVVAVMLVVVAAFAPGKQPGRYAALNLVCITLLNYVLKEIVQRPRPEGFRLVAESGYSFPSGHSMVAMAFYGLLIWMIWRYEKKQFEKWIFSLFLAFLILGIAVSRIYLGVHYASDVIAGMAVSLVWLSVFTRLIGPAFMDE